MIGVLIGPLVSGQISDRFGRKTAYVIFYIGFCISGVLTPISKNWQVFAGFRILLGFFIGSLIPIIFVLFVESLTARWRLLPFLGGWPLAFIVFLSIFIFQKSKKF